MAKEIVLRTKLKGAQKTKQGLKGIDSGLKSLGRSALNAGAAYFGARGIISGFKMAVDAAGKQEMAEKKLEASLGRTSQALLNQASALQQVSMFGDEAIIEAQALIAAFVDDEEQIKAATKATLDLAAAKGMDLTAAADLVSKTLGSSTNAMSRYGIEVTGAVGSTERLSTLTDNVAEKFGGQASAQAQTMTGQIEQMKNALGDTAELIGERLMPSLVEFAKKTKHVAEFWSDFLGIGKKTDETFGKFSDETTVNLNRQIERLTGNIEYQRDLLKDYGTDAEKRLMIDKRAEDQGNTLIQQVMIENQMIRDKILLREELETKLNNHIEGQRILSKLGEVRNDSELQYASEVLPLVASGMEKVKAKEIDFVKIKKEKQQLMIQELKQAALVQGSAQDAMKAVVRAETMEAVAGYIASVLKSVPFPLNVVLAAGGGAVASGLIDKGLSSFAQGGDFVTSGPQMMMVGDNPGGRERVQVTPIGSPNIEGPQGGGGIHLHFGAVTNEDYVKDFIVPEIQKAQRLNLA